MIEITKTNSSNKDFKTLITQLDSELRERYGELQNEYDQYNIIEFNENVLIAYEDKTAVACGCFKEFDADTVEIKRMFVRKDYRGKGISRHILNELEACASEKGYNKAILETGIKQMEAIGLYLKNGYKKIENYGQYTGLPVSVCFSKKL
jgi:putative acetyltransferase